MTREQIEINYEKSLQAWREDLRIRLNKLTTMKVKTVITAKHIDTGAIEVFSTFVVACRIKALPYHTLKTWKMPIIYGDYIIERKPLQ